MRISCTILKLALLWGPAEAERERPVSHHDNQKANNEHTLIDPWAVGAQEITTENQVESPMRVDAARKTTINEAALRQNAKAALDAIAVLRVYIPGAPNYGPAMGGMNLIKNLVDVQEFNPSNIELLIPAPEHFAEFETMRAACLKVEDGGWPVDSNGKELELQNGKGSNYNEAKSFNYGGFSKVITGTAIGNVNSDISDNPFFQPTEYKHVKQSSDRSFREILEVYAPNMVLAYVAEETYERLQPPCTHETTEYDVAVYSWTEHSVWSKLQKLYPDWPPYENLKTKLWFDLDRGEANSTRERFFVSDWFAEPQRLATLSTDNNLPEGKIAVLAVGSQELGPFTIEKVRELGMTPEDVTANFDMKVMLLNPYTWGSSLRCVQWSPGGTILNLAERTDGVKSHVAGVTGVLGMEVSTFADFSQILEPQCEGLQFQDNAKLLVAYGVHQTHEGSPKAIIRNTVRALLANDAFHTFFVVIGFDALPDAWGDNLPPNLVITKIERQDGNTAENQLRGKFTNFNFGSNRVALFQVPRIDSTLFKQFQRCSHLPFITEGANTAGELVAMGRPYILVSDKGTHYFTDGTPRSIRHLRTLGRAMQVLRKLEPTGGEITFLSSVFNTSQPEELFWTGKLENSVKPFYDIVTTGLYALWYLKEHQTPEETTSLYPPAEGVLMLGDGCVAKNSDTFCNKCCCDRRGKLALWTDPEPYNATCGAYLHCVATAKGTCQSAR